MLSVGSLFSGIGGLDLGLERAGMRVRWQCEIDPYCRAILRKHWPGVPCYLDVRELASGVEPVDVLAGGFPCQPVSQAGRKLAGGPMHRERVWILANPHPARLEGPVWAGKPLPARREREAARGEPLRSAGGHWPPGPGSVADIPRMADGSAHRNDRLRALGNAVVPQVAEAIGRMIVERERNG